MTLVAATLETLDYVTASAVSSPAAETAILSTDVVQPNVIQSPNVNQPPTTVRPVVIKCTLNITEGTTGTSYFVTCRRGVGAGGSIVAGPYTVTLAAAALDEASFIFRDTSGTPFAPGGTAYTVTVGQNGATAAGTVNYIDIEVLN